MAISRRNRSHRGRRELLGFFVCVERLESRVPMSAGITLDRASRTINIVGSAGNDTAQVRQNGSNVVVSLTTPTGRFNQTYRANTVSRVVFSGLAGNDSFSNLAALPSRADGGSGNDTLRGGRVADELLGGDGSDQLFGDAGNDSLNGGSGNDSIQAGAGNDQVLGGDGLDSLTGNDGVDELWGGDGSDTLDGGSGNDLVVGEGGDDEIGGGAGDDLVRGGDGGDTLIGGSGSDSLEGGANDDWLDGGVGGDRLVGDAGLDRESDSQDRFADGDDDGDGYDNDYDLWDILYEPAEGPSPYANDATVAPIIASVGVELRRVLRIADNDAGLRVRVQNGQFGNLVTGVWRYLTPDKIQIWAKWAYPANDPAQLKLFVQYSYTGPYSGDMADYTNPDNYVISEESRIYAGYMVTTAIDPTALGGRPSVTLSWLPNQAANFYYTAPSQENTGFAPPIQPLTAALGTLPNFYNYGDSFSADLSSEPGIRSVQSIVDLLRKISQVNSTWYAQRRAESRR
ncbi:MAG: calcium-binding protein [Planctomycetota bacterium]